VCTAGKMGSRCEVVTRMETPHMGLSDGNPLYGSVGWKLLVWVCHVLYCLPIETRETSRTGFQFVGVYTCVYLRMHIHGCICMRVCEWGLSKIYEYRGSQELKKGPRIDIAKWVPKDWVCVRTRKNNLSTILSMRHINDTD